MAADEEWLLATIERYQGSLLTYVGRLLGQVDSARDVVQETFLKLCQQDRSEVEPRLAAWLFSVCRNHVRDLQRKSRRMTAAEQALIDRQRGLEDEVATAADGEVESVHELLAELTEQQQEVVRLKFLHELSYKEISEVTGLSLGNVGYILHHALVRLRKAAKVGGE